AASWRTRDVVVDAFALGSAVVEDGTTDAASGLATAEGSASEAAAADAAVVEEALSIWLSIGVHPRGTAEGNDPSPTYPSPGDRGLRGADFRLGGALVGLQSRRRDGLAAAGRVEAEAHGAQRGGLDRDRVGAGGAGADLDVQADARRAEDGAAVERGRVADAV